VLTFASAKTTQFQLLKQGQTKQSISILSFEAAMNSLCLFVAGDVLQSWLEGDWPRGGAARWKSR